MDLAIRDNVKDRPKSMQVLPGAATKNVILKQNTKNAVSCSKINLVSFQRHIFISYSTVLSVRNLIAILGIFPLPSLRCQYKVVLLSQNDGF